MLFPVAEFFLMGYYGAGIYGKSTLLLLLQCTIGVEGTTFKA